MSVLPRITASPRENIALLVYFMLSALMASAMPGAVLSATASVASGVWSRGGEARAAGGEYEVELPLVTEPDELRLERELPVRQPELFHDLVAAALQLTGYRGAGEVLALACGALVGEGYHRRLIGPGSGPLGNDHLVAHCYGPALEHARKHALARHDAVAHRFIYIAPGIAV